KWHDLAAERPRALRKEHYRAAILKVAADAEQHTCAAFGVGPVELDVTGQPHHPSHKWNLEQLRFRHPLHLPREAADYGDVGQRLMVADDHVRPPRILDAMPRDMDAPHGVHLRHHPPQPAEPVAGAVEGRVAVEQADDGEHRKPANDEDRYGAPRPQGSEHLTSQPGATSSPLHTRRRRRP